MGYVGGLLDTDLSKEMRKCGYWKANARKSFDDAYDLLQ